MANWDFCDICNSGGHCSRHFPSSEAQSQETTERKLRAQIARLKNQNAKLRKALEDK